MRDNVLNYLSICAYIRIDVCMNKSVQSVSFFGYHLLSIYPVFYCLLYLPSCEVRTVLLKSSVRRLGFLLVVLRCSSIDDSASRTREVDFNSNSRTLIHSKLFEIHNMYRRSCCCVHLVISVSYICKVHCRCSRCCVHLVVQFGTL